MSLVCRGALQCAPTMSKDVCHSEEPFGYAQDLRLRDEESRC